MFFAKPESYSGTGAGPSAVAGMVRVFLPLVLVVIANTGWAGEADVLKAVASQSGAGTWRFDVTIKSNDKGLDYYCDRFEIVGSDNQVLGTRILVHPHVEEQPFTRSLGSVRIPADVKQVTVRAAMKPNGAGGEVFVLKLK